MKKRNESLKNRRSEAIKTLEASFLSIFCGLFLGAVIVFLVSLFVEEISQRGGL